MKFEIQIEKKWIFHAGTTAWQVTHYFVYWNCIRTKVSALPLLHKFPTVFIDLPPLKLCITKNIIILNAGIKPVKHSSNIMGKTAYTDMALYFFVYSSSPFLKIGCIWGISSVSGSYPVTNDKWSLWTKAIVIKWTQCFTNKSGT
jgi:hypothetical protein